MIFPSFATTQPNGPPVLLTTPASRITLMASRIISLSCSVGAMIDVLV
jgi:hypothetical protein